MTVPNFTYQKLIATPSSGKIFPLVMADRLADYIVGTVVETIETEKLIGEFGQIILNDVYTNATPTADVAQKLHAFMKEKGVKINTIEVENVYNETEASKKNIASWGSAENLKKGREAVTPVSSHRTGSQNDTNKIYVPPKITAPRMQAEFVAGKKNPSYSMGPQPSNLAQVNNIYFSLLVL